MKAHGNKRVEFAFRELLRLRRMRVPISHNGVGQGAEQAAVCLQFSTCVCFVAGCNFKINIDDELQRVVVWPTGCLCLESCAALPMREGARVQ